MKLVDFVDDYNMSPLDDEDFAYGAMQVEDHEELKYAARQFIQAKKDFHMALDHVGVEIG